MLRNQGGVCAICGEIERVVKQDGLPRQISVDHCHKTGHFRGLLCGNCNRAIGLFGDDIDVLASAISYLQQRQLAKVKIA